MISAMYTEFCVTLTFEQGHSLIHNMPAPYGEHLCQVISKFPNKWQIKSLDKIGRTYRWKQRHRTVIVTTKYSYCKWARQKSPNEWWIYSAYKLYYAHIKPLTSKCDPDLLSWGHESQGHHGEHLWPVISKCPNKWQIYSPDKLYYAHIKPLTSKCDPDLWTGDMSLKDTMVSICGQLFQNAPINDKFTVRTSCIMPILNLWRLSVTLTFELGTWVSRTPWWAFVASYFKMPQ